MSHCPFCKSRINRYDGRHIYRCQKNSKIKEKGKIKYEFLLYNFPVISQKNVIFDEYVVKLKSLPDLKKDYNISYNNIIFLLDFFDIKKRTINISSKQISSKKYKNTCLNKYGVDNISKLKSIKVKKINSKRLIINNLNNYIELKNLLISQNYKLKDDVLDKKIKKDYYIFLKRCYKYWLNLADEQKDLLIDKNYSKLESKVTGCLDQLDISYIKKFSIGKNFYDIKIKNILIEVFSDYWHANPKFYKDNEYIDYLFKKIKCKNIWKTDLNKKKIAELNGYKLIQIWENEIKDLSGDDLLKYISEKIFYI